MTVHYSLAVKTAASTDPVTAAQAKAHARVDISDDDALIGYYITAATQWAQAFRGQQFVDATFTQIFDGFPNAIELARSPVDSVTHIKYVDTAGDTQTLSSDNYQTDLASEPARIVCALGYSWPTTRDQLQTVEIEYVAGYGAAAAVPENVKTAIKQLVAHWYEHREVVGEARLQDVPFTVKSLLWPERVMRMT